MNVLESVRILISHENVDITHHLLESVQIRLVELGMHECQVSSVPNNHLLPYAIKHLSNSASLAPLVIIAAFIEETDLAAKIHYAAFIASCYQYSLEKGVPLIAAWLFARDLSQARDQVFGPVAKVGYHAADLVQDVLKHNEQRFK